MSAGVAHTLIEGLVVKRLVFRCCVNVPTDVQISSVTGSFCRVYRLVFGLAPNTPRACVVSILERAAPDHVLWATVIKELFQSLNGPNTLLAQTVWAHWSNPCLHRFNGDSHRIQSRRQHLHIHFRKLVSGQGTKWCVSPPLGGAFPEILYVFGDASVKDCWGEAAKVVDNQGHVWLDASVSLFATGLSTKLVEASVVVSVVVAIAEDVSTHGMSTKELWVWSDCLSAVQCLQSRDLADKTASVMDEVVSHFVLTHLPVQMGWVPAQHDTDLDDWISSFNSEMDSEAKAGARGERKKVSVLDVWLHGDSIPPFQGDRLIIDLKRHLLSRSDDALLSVSLSRSPTSPERSWRMVLQESVSGLKCWMQLQPLGIEHWGRIRAWSVYASADQWEWQHRDTECSLCSMWCHSVIQHRFHGCMFTKVRVLARSRQLCVILYAAGIPRNRILLRWGGVEILGHPGLCIVWCHPATGAAISNSTKSVNPMCPIWLGLGPIRGISLVLSKLGVSEPHILIYQILESAYAMVHGGFDAGNVKLLCPQLHSQWTPRMNSDVLPGFQPQAAHLDSHTPTNLLWVLFSSVRGTGYVGHVLVSYRGGS